MDFYLERILVRDQHILIFTIFLPQSANSQIFLDFLLLGHVLNSQVGFVGVEYMLFFGVKETKHFHLIIYYNSYCFHLDHFKYVTPISVIGQQ